MSWERKQINSLLRVHGALLVRQSNHRVYRFPCGRIFVESASPSDRHAEKASLRTLRRIVVELSR
jgi:hypothetical protein